MLPTSIPCRIEVFALLRCGRVFAGPNRGLAPKGSNPPLLSKRRDPSDALARRHTVASFGKARRCLSPRIARACLGATVLEQLSHVGTIELVLVGRLEVILD